MKVTINVLHCCLFLACIGCLSIVRGSGTYFLNVGGLESWDAPAAMGTPNVHSDAGVLLLTTWFGAYPCILSNPDGSLNWCNGGLPQLANLSTHHDEMVRDLQYINVSASYKGYVVNDYESWTPSWNTTPSVYQNGSIELARSLLPANATSHEILCKAIADYERAAIDFLVFTVTAMKKLLPLAAGHGFYGYPSIHGYWVNVSWSAAINNKLMRLWEALPTFYPSIYLPYKSNVDVPFARNVEYVEQQVNESIRIAEMIIGNRTPEILPYSWYRYHDGEPHGLEFLSDTDMALEFQRPLTKSDCRSRGDGAPKHNASVCKIIIWGDETCQANITLTEQFFVKHRAVFGGSDKNELPRWHSSAPTHGLRPKGGPLPPWKQCSL